jgi:hypothetical protein
LDAGQQLARLIVIIVVVAIVVIWVMSNR